MSQGTTPSFYEAAQDKTADAVREPVAIIGMSCRFAGGVTSPEAFWDLLRESVDAISEVPQDRWNINTFYDPSRTKPGKANTRWGGFLEQVDQFDAQFFQISPREAALMDPQQRLLLEVCWEALEDGGQVPERLAGSRTGVFMGAFTLDYKVLQFSESNRHLVDSHTATGAMMTLVANRLSYVYDLRGPSVALDTACSSSLVAVHLACQSIWSGESSLALAGGVNVMCKPDYTIAESKAGMLSPDGRSKAFDSSANGYVRGEGAGVVVLKPLSRALADGDPIHAVIRGTAVNQDGRSPGITVPSGEAQQALLREAYGRAGVEPKQIQYVEAHGTGTPVGDPLEVNALGAVLSAGRPEGSECYIASVKTNIGHTEAAAGVAGLIKTTLALKHQQIPAHLHLKNPNPQINFEKLRLRVPQSLTPWPEGDRPALAGVNSFGFGGTNAHVVLEEFPRRRSAPRAEDGRAHLLPLSARSPEALRAYAEAYRRFLTSRDEESAATLREIGYTAALRRTHHPYRLGVVARTEEELAERLAAFAAGENPAGVASADAPAGGAPRLAFVFSGMGPQWWAMGRQLLAEEPVFRAAVEEIDELFRPHAGWSLLEEMLADEEHSRMGETEVAQPANFALQVGLAALWRSWGIEPDAIVGHSAGEAAAAYAAGVMSLEEAVRVIFHRSRLQQLTTGQGRLVAVGLPLAEAEAAIRDYADRVSIAAINSPSAVTLVGDPEALEAVVAPLQERRVFCKYLQVKVPYHSHYMNPLREELLEVLAGLELKQASVPLYSTVTGEAADGREFDAEYWWRNVREPVFFAAATERLIADGYTAFLEVGPHPVLAGSITECLSRQGQTAAVVSSLRRNEEERATLLAALGRLYAQGCAVTWETLYAGGGRCVPLPPYPWQRERYWHESEASEQDRLRGDVHPLLGRRVAALHPTWESDIDTRKLPFLDDHRIQETVVYPGAAYAEMGLAAARQIFGEGAEALEERDVEFRKALFMPEGETVKLRLTLNPRDASFDIYSQAKGSPQSWTLHATGRLCQRQNPAISPRVAVDELLGRCADEVPREVCYQQFRTLGLEYGATFQGIERLWQGRGEALAQVRLPEGIAAEVGDYQIHPAVLDVCFQVMAASLPFRNTAEGEKGTVYMPVGVARGGLVSHGGLTPRMWIHARLTEKTDNQLKGDIRLCDEDGNVLLEIEDCRATSLEKTQGAGSVRAQALYEVRWQERERAAEADDAAHAAEPGTWLILADAAGPGDALAAQLEAKGERCVMAYPAETYRVSEDGRRYELNPAAPEEFERLLSDALGADAPACRGVVHLWASELAAADATTLDTLARAESVGALAVMHLMQALARVNWQTPPRLWIVTRGAQQTGADEAARLSVAQAPLWGLGRAFGEREHSDFWGGLIDLEYGADSGDAPSLFAEVWRPDGEDQLAFRGGRRYVARLAESARAAAPMPPTFRADASYLITGGMGGLGLLVARWMVERGARRLILLGRESLPARALWNEAEAGSRLAERLAAIREIEALGASVHVAGFDVSDEAQLSSFLEGYRREGWPAIRGVVHSAGVARPQLLMETDAAALGSTLRPKVYGAWLLHRLLEDAPLDFFVLFSSIASVAPLPGQSDYAAGNAFMDALSHYRRARGLAALSVNWGPWAEVGMATQLDLTEHFERRGLFPMTPDQGLQALSTLIGQGTPQATVVSADWPLVGQWYPKGKAAPILSDLIARSREADSSAQAQGAEGGAGFVRELQLADAATRQSLLESHLRDLAAGVLRLSRSRLDPEQPLNVLGLDSMMAIELKNSIESSLGVTLAVVDLLKGATVAQLAADLAPQLREEEQPAGEEETARILAELEQLSTEEVAALLNEVELSAAEA